MADCLNVQGQAETQSLVEYVNNQVVQVQVGNLTMVPVPGPGSVPKFRAVFGQNFLAGGIRGEINSQGPTTVYLRHEIGFPGVGSVITSQDTAEITHLDPNGLLTVKEFLNIVGAQNGGLFTGWTGTLEADGVLDLQKGVNTFSYAGQLCKGP